LIVWWFRFEISGLITRGFKFKGFGFEMESEAAEVKLALEDAKAASRPEAIKQVETLLVQAYGKVAASAAVKFDLIDGLNLLMEMPAKDPRTAIKRSWELLAKTVLRRANVKAEDLEPNSEGISAALKRLEFSSD
jgi:hypothetical protein